MSTILYNWIGWLQVRIPALKKSQNVFWLKQAMEGYKSDSSKMEHTARVEPSTEQSVLSAEEYLKESRKGLSLPEQIFRDHAINLMESFANLRVEQEREKWEKQKQEALKASVSALYFDDSSDYSSYHYKVIMTLTGEENPDVDKLYKILNHGK